ncbi:MAG: UvrD-helicase domain-containing protein, partial [Planctomycetota bacterium]|nr:UvrD-helicase domain-containing protein [Planctomycetota bacterium]
MATLHVISAGAGSGKTYQLCETIAEKVSNKTLDPARILATTFTRKAAAEIKGRIQSRLLKNDAVPPLERLEMAQRLELAAIGTVHSVGHQLLSRYAIQFGLSPNLKVLEAENTSRYLSEIIGK